MFFTNNPANTASGTYKVVPIAGFPVLEATQQRLASYLLSSLRQRRQTILLFANSNFIVKCRNLLLKMRNRSVLLVNDGVGMDIVARLMRGRSFKENLNGTDFIPYLLQQSERPLRVFLLGARHEVVSRAASHVAEKLGQQVVGYADGYADMQDNQALVDRINQAETEVLLVALGNPLQEAWILQNRQQLSAGIVSGVGALFDFWAGDKPRAPRWVQKIRMEWCYRLCLEPRRLFRRYTLDILVFLTHCFKYRRYY